MSNEPTQLPPEAQGGVPGDGPGQTPSQAPTGASGDARADGAGAPEPLSRWQRLRRHPLIGRLPILLVIGIGYWLWNDPSGPGERELIFELQGPDRAQVRQFEVQVKSQDGVLFERAQRYFDAEPPREIRLKARLPQERLDLLLFARDAQGRVLPLEHREVEISEREAYLLRVMVRAPAPGQAPVSH